MNRYTELLGLNEIDVENIATAYSGYALAMEREAEDEAYKLPIIASSWLIGALFKSLISSVESKKYFHNASKAYQKLNWPIWRICAICSLDYDYSTPKMEMLSDEERFYSLLQESLSLEIQKRPEYSKFKNDDIAGRIPGLDIPYNIVLQAIEHIKYTNDKMVKSDVKNVTDVFQRLSELLEQYQADDHWKNLEGPILPFEPTALAIVIVILKTWKRSNSIKELHPFGNSNIQALIGIALNLLNEE